MLLLVGKQRLLSVVEVLSVAALLVPKSLLLLMLLLLVVAAWMLLTVSLLVTSGCILLTDASGWADIGQLCSVYGACTA